jgi:hypothetical protein
MYVATQPATGHNLHCAWARAPPAASRCLGARVRLLHSTAALVRVRGEIMGWIIIRND